MSSPPASNIRAFETSEMAWLPRVILAWCGRMRSSRSTDKRTGRTLRLFFDRRKFEGRNRSKGGHQLMRAGVGSHETRDANHPLLGEGFETPSESGIRYLSYRCHANVTPKRPVRESACSGDDANCCSVIINAMRLDNGPVRGRDGITPNS